MLFLYRPRQTWMPFARPQNFAQQAAYNRQLQDKFESTRTIPSRTNPPPVAAPAPRDTIGDLQRLGELHRTGVLTDAEFATVKARLLAE
jgi:hypothetical protein